MVLMSFLPLSSLHLSKVRCLMFLVSSEGGLGEAVLREGPLADLLCKDVNNRPFWLLTRNLFDVPTQIGLCYTNKCVPEEVFELRSLYDSRVGVRRSEDVLVTQGAS